MQLSTLIRKVKSALVGKLFHRRILKLVEINKFSVIYNFEGANCK